MSHTHTCALPWQPTFPIGLFAMGPMDLVTAPTAMVFTFPSRLAMPAATLGSAITPFLISPTLVVAVVVGWARPRRGSD